MAYRYLYKLSTKSILATGSIPSQVRQQVRHHRVRGPPQPLQVLRRLRSKVGVAGELHQVGVLRYETILSSGSSTGNG